MRGAQASAARTIQAGHRMENAFGKKRMLDRIKPIQRKQAGRDHGGHDPENPTSGPATLYYRRPFNHLRKQQITARASRLMERGLNFWFVQHHYNPNTNS